MKFLRVMAASAVGLVALSGTTIAAARAAAPATMSVLPGTWNCTTHGSTGTSTGTVTFNQILPNLVQFHYVDTSGKNAGHKGGGEWFYDTKKGEYVSLGAGNWGWGVSRGAASANAMTVTLLDTYPSDPANATTTYHFASSTISFTSDWKQNGKAMRIQQTCTRA
jgi:outer membrane lipoprotein-sorting protein